MRFVMLAFALLPAAAVAQETPYARSEAQQRPACKAERQMVGPRHGQSVRPQPLEQQPRAMQYYAVLRTDPRTGCQKIAMVRDRQGDEQH